MIFAVVLDPALVSAMGVAAVRGLHGGNTEGPSSYLPSGTIVSEAKHAAACESAVRCTVGSPFVASVALFKHVVSHGVAVLA